MDPNTRVNLPVRPVTTLACASGAPTRPASGLSGTFAHMNRMSVLAIVLLGGLLGCASSTPDDPPSVRHLLSDPSKATPTSIDPSDSLHWVIEEAEDMNVFPSGVLSVQVSIPQLFGHKAYVFPLDRKQVTADYLPRASGRAEAADGVSEDGHGIGYVGGVNIVDSTGNEITVEASFAGRGASLKRVDLTRRFTVPWGGRFEGTFNGEGRIVASISVGSM
jgi:hypothetical protein